MKMYSEDKHLRGKQNFSWKMQRDGQLGHQKSTNFVMAGKSAVLLWRPWVNEDAKIQRKKSEIIEEEKENKEERNLEMILEKTDLSRIDGERK